MTLFSLAEKIRLDVTALFQYTLVLTVSRTYDKSATSL